MADNEITIYEPIDKEKVKAQIYDIRGFRVMLDKDKGREKMPKAITTERTNVPLSEDEMSEWHVKENPLKAPNHMFLELTHAGTTKTGIGSNKFYRMENNGDGTWTATYGRIGGGNEVYCTPRSCVWPMDMWDSKYYEKAQKRGYLLIQGRNGKEGFRKRKQDGDGIFKNPERFRA